MVEENHIKEKRCTICRAIHKRLASKLCENCWKLEASIQRNPEAAHKIMAALTKWR